MDQAWEFLVHACLFLTKYEDDLWSCFRHFFPGFSLKRGWKHIWEVQMILIFQKLSQLAHKSPSQEKKKKKCSWHWNLPFYFHLSLFLYHPYHNHDLYHPATAPNPSFFGTCSWLFLFYVMIYLTCCMFTVSRQVPKFSHPIWFTLCRFSSTQM